MAKANTDKLITEFQKWRTQLAEGWDAVHDALEAGNLVEACRIMDAITMEQANASVAMRGILVRAGHSARDLDSDD